MVHTVSFYLWSIANTGKLTVVVVSTKINNFALLVIQELERLRRKLLMNGQTEA